MVKPTGTGHTDATVYLHLQAYTHQEPIPLDSMGLLTKNQSAKSLIFRESTLELFRFASPTVIQTRLELPPTQFELWLSYNEAALRKPFGPPHLGIKQR